jgi:hypothetical protein
MNEAGDAHIGYSASRHSIFPEHRASQAACTDEDHIDIVAWFAQWLCKWSFFAFPDADMRDAALDLARQKQFRR